MSAQTDPLYLPLVVIDISNLRSHRRRHTPIDEDEVVARSRSRRSRFLSAAKTNIVRLIPGATRLPYEPAAR